MRAEKNVKSVAGVAGTGTVTVTLALGVVGVAPDDHDACAGLDTRPGCREAESGRAPDDHDHLVRERAIHGAKLSGALR